MDEIVRIKTCDFCKREVREQYIGSASELNPRCFKVETSNLVLVPPEGKSKSWTLCEACSANMEMAIMDAVNRRAVQFVPSKKVS